MKKLFTLIEILLVSVIFSLILVVMISLYSKLTQVRVYVEWRKYLVENSYFLMEKLNVLMKNYTIDYEEYFNRRMVGCNWNGGDNFSWNVWNDWYCKKFTNYGNIGDNDSTEDYWFLYKCSSKTGDDVNIIKETNLVNNKNWCWYNALINVSPNFTYQWYWEYKEQFWDYGDDIDDDGNVVWDYDDIDLGAWPIAVANNTWVQELYLISKDWLKRIFFRRKLILSWDFNFDWIVWNTDIDKRYGIQILKLRWFDAWSKHDFDKNNSFWVYDWQIDTWACDASEGFKCSWSQIPNYNWFNLPNGVEDWWENIVDKKITISKWNIQIFPPKDPEYAWAENAYTFNPYVRINIRAKLYGTSWVDKINPDILSWFVIDLSTTFDMKSY